MGLTSPNSYSKDSRFEQSIKKRALKEKEKEMWELNAELQKKKLKKGGKTVLEAHSGEWAVFQKFSFYFHILESGISYIKDEFLLKKKPYVSGNYGKKRMDINVKGIVHSIKHVYSLVHDY